MARSPIRSFSPRINTHNHHRNVGPPGAQLRPGPVPALKSIAHTTHRTPRHLLPFPSASPRSHGFTPHLLSPAHEPKSPAVQAPASQPTGRCPLNPRPASSPGCFQPRHTAHARHTTNTLVSVSSARRLASSSSSFSCRIWRRVDWSGGSMRHWDRLLRSVSRQP